jgi:hypothetical protein
VSPDDFLTQLPRATTADGHHCLCSHRRDWHRHGDDGRACIRACGCSAFRQDSRARTEAVQDGTSAATGTDG